MLEVPAATQASGGRLRGPSAARWAAAAVVVVAVAALGYAAYTRFLARTEPASYQTVPVSRGTVSAAVNSTGTVAAIAVARLSFRASGRVAEVLVRTGDRVAKAQALVKLDGADLSLQVAQAQASLDVAEAKLATIMAASRAEEIAAARAQVVAATSRLDAMLAGGRPEDVELARASLASAKAKLSQLKSSPTEADLRSAEQTVAAAEAAAQKAQGDLAKLKAGPTDEDLRGGELSVEQARNNLWATQIDRDGICGNKALPAYQCDAANARVASSETALAIAQNNLARLKSPARQEDVDTADRALASAQAQLASAGARLQQVRAGPTADDLVVAQAAVTQAEQQLALKQKPYSESDIQAQRQAVAQAESALALKRNPFTEADLRSAQAGVDQARAQLDAAKLNLTNATLVAPFDGVVNAVNANVGEYASGTAAAPVVVIVDPDALRFDVSVDEADISVVETGQRAKVTFDALPGTVLDGRVTAIAPNAVVQAGIATYQVSISLTGGGSVRPGMTGNAAIVYSERENVLFVPNRALRSQAGAKAVDVLLGGQLQTRKVVVGLSDDQQSEIVEGLSEGEQVVIPVTTTLNPLRS